jgi:hypothetical protein
MLGWIFTSTARRRWAGSGRVDDDGDGGDGGEGDGSAEPLAAV